MTHHLVVFCHFQNEPQDLLFILTARYRVFILSYKPETGDVVTRAYGDMKVHWNCFCVVSICLWELKVTKAESNLSFKITNNIIIIIINSNY